MANKFERLSLHETAQLIKSSARESSLPTRELMMLYERLMDIAFLDHGVPDSDRSAAEQLAESVKQAVIRSDLSTDAKSGFKSAIAAHKEHITRFGRGSVIWNTEEPELQRQQTFSERQQTFSGVSPELQDHLDKTSDTIGALGFSVHYYVAELLKLALQKRIASGDEIGSMFDRLTELVKDEPNAYYKEKIESMAELIRKTVLG